MNVLQMFRMGNDYLQIAAYFGTTEAIVEKAIHELRLAERVKNSRKALDEEILAKRRIYKREYMARQREQMRKARAER